MPRPRWLPRLRLIPLWRYALAGACVPIGACAAPQPLSPPGPLRVMVKVPQGTAATDQAWQTRLSNAAGVPVRHAASISAEWSAYWLDCGGAQAACEDALAALSQSGVAVDMTPDLRRNAR